MKRLTGHGRAMHHVWTARLFVSAPGASPRNRVFVSASGAAPRDRVFVSPPGTASPGRVFVSAPGTASRGRVFVSAPGAPSRGDRGALVGPAVVAIGVRTGNARCRDGGLSRQRAGSHVERLVDRFPR
ncbi:hypothetical protein Axi01nite_36390 [Actinoplanes xinjiangensis]|nr:hypothetical protein Axi01nite_36390 [Actinoplanes xinjiangensis]